MLKPYRFIVSVSLLVLPADAFAGGDPIIQGAQAAETAEDWSAAVDGWTAAISAGDSPSLRIHRGHCEERLVRLVAANADYAAADQLLRNGATDAEAARLLPEKVRKLRLRIPLLTLRLPRGVQASAVQIDGRPEPASVLTKEIAFDPGAHRVRVEANGRQSYDVTVKMTEGVTLAQDVDLPLLPPRARAEVTRHDPPEPPLWEAAQLAHGDARTWTLTLGATASLTAFGIAGGYYLSSRNAGSDAARAQDTIDAAHAGQPCAHSSTNLAGACGELETDVARRESRERTAGIALAAGIAGLTITTVAALLWHPNRSTATVGRAGVVLVF